jgi:hypothetical protein
MAEVKQALGEHIQSFLWRVEMDLESKLANGKELEDATVVKIAIRGLLPQVVAAMPKQKTPWTKDQLLWYGDNLRDYLQSSDPFWQGSLRPELTLPDISVSVVNEYAGYFPPNNDKCFKCGINGHFAFQCNRKRDNKLRKNRNRKSNNLKYVMKK